ncbi:hypothetical protein [Photobacterium aquimaris]|uniref:Lipoprotein n=1 Tax=Photobacterium aquimaris TaxID=512643 RepID=A0A1Y6KVL2_9GAMM|nr:hypothetical protein [Photobacterium aquimaris]SMY16229.1 hypothetical protein PAQU9191_01460 [Photobacterium aquimaris]
MKLVIILVLPLLLVGCSSAQQGTLPIDKNQDNNGKLVIYNGETRASNIIDSAGLLSGLAIPLAPSFQKTEAIINGVVVGELKGFKPLVLPIKAGTHTYTFHHTYLVSSEAHFIIAPKETKYFYLSNSPLGVSFIETTKDSFTRCANKFKPLCMPEFIKPIKI